MSGERVRVHLYPGVDGASVTRLWPEIGILPPSILDHLHIDAQYAVYLDRQRSDVEAVRRHARKALGQLVHERTKRRPMIVPVVMEA